MDELTNEALALRVKEGDKEAELLLWQNVEPLITMQAVRFYVGVKLHRPQQAAAFEVCDLTQQAFFAVLEAARYYDPDEEYKYTTYLSYTLKNAFRSVVGIRTSKRDACAYAESMDAPLSLDGNDEGELTLASLIPDPAAEQQFDMVLDADEALRIREALKAAADDLLWGKPKQIFIRHALEGVPFVDLSVEMGLTEGAVCNFYENALFWIKTCPDLRTLHLDINKDQTSGIMRNTEQAALRLIQLDEKDAAVQRVYESRKRKVAQRNALHQKENAAAHFTPAPSTP